MSAIVRGLYRRRGPAVDKAAVIRIASAAGMYTGLQTIGAVLLLTVVVVGALEDSREFVPDTVTAASRWILVGRLTYH